MNTPTPATLFAALDATWPAHGITEHAGWLLRDGAGGGKRVSAASPLESGADIGEAEVWMQGQGTRALFRLTPADTALDAALALRGYALLDPTILYAAPVAALAEKPPSVSLFDIWPPLAIMREIWAAGGITAPRLAVMARASTPMTGLIARRNDRAAGVAFCALYQGVAMLHAVEVAPAMRHRGVGRLILRGAAYWAQQQGGEWLALAVTEANTGARALYEGAGMVPVTRYHYREKHDDAAGNTA